MRCIPESDVILAPDVQVLTVSGSPCSACRMKLLTTRPSFMCMRGPKVLKIRATRTSTPSCSRGKRKREDAFHSTTGACTQSSPLLGHLVGNSLKHRWLPGFHSGDNTVVSNQVGYVPDLKKPLGGSPATGLGRGGGQVCIRMSL